MVKIKIENNAIYGIIGIIFALFAVKKFKEDETKRTFKKHIMAFMDLMKFRDNYSNK